MKELVSIIQLIIAQWVCSSRSSMTERGTEGPMQTTL